MESELNVTDLIKWKETAKILYASRHGNGYNKQLFTTANGGFEVWSNGELKHDGIQPSVAVDFFNNIQLLNQPKS